MLQNINLSKSTFKFVSYRKILSTETEEKYIDYINRPPNIYGVFDLAIDNSENSKSSHQEIMRRTANKFYNFCFKNTNEIDNSIFGEIFFIGRKISTTKKINDYDCSILKDYYNQLTSNTKLLNENDYRIITMLWDNYIYHNVIKQDFITKEAISIVIRALHIGYVKSLTFDDDEIKIPRGRNPLQNAINSTLILPKKLFPTEF